MKSLPEEDTAVGSLLCRFTASVLVTQAFKPHKHFRVNEREDFLVSTFALCSQNRDVVRPESWLRGSTPPF